MRCKGFWVVLLILAAAVAPMAAHAESVVASVIAIDGKLTLDRPGQGHYAAFVQMPDYVRDTLTTDAQSVAAVEFAVGGKIGINKGSSVRIIGNRVAADARSGQVMRLDSGTIWAKFQHQKSPLIIRTRNSAIGIRGTEFLVQADQDSTTIDVFQGTVAYESTKPGEEPTELPANAATAGPGTRVIIKAALQAQVQNYDPKKLREEDAERNKALASALVALHIVSDIAGFIPGGSPVQTYAGYAAWGVDAVKDPEQAAKDFAANEVAAHVPGGGLLGGMFGGGGHQKKDPPFVVGLQPYQTEQSPAALQFSWKPFKGAKQYVVLVSPDENMSQDNLAWATQTTGTNAGYPADGPPLQGGQKYFWRVVAMGDDGKPKGKASQTWFTVPAGYKAPTATP